jgi:hypothetical protein
MQERRNTIRLHHFCRAQYCPFEDPVPRDGRITTLSERGAGLLVRSAHAIGERLTVNFSLPGDQDPMTATGVVRWSGLQLPRGGWYPLGIEWLPLDEATRNRLHRFLYSRPPAPAPRTPSTTPASAPGRAAAPISARVKRRGAIAAGAAYGALVASGVYVWVNSLEQENRRLESVIVQRNRTIQQLQEEEQRLQEVLGETKTRLASTTGEVTRLDQESKSLKGEVEQLGGDVERFQRSYVRVSGEREQLIRRIMDLEQERAALAKRVASLEELQLAVREAIELRRQQPPYVYVETQQELDRKELIEGNQGYLVREGRQTSGGSSGLWIRVHDPEAGGQDGLESGASASDPADPPLTATP